MCTLLGEGEDILSPEQQRKLNKVQGWVPTVIVGSVFGLLSIFHYIVYLMGDWRLVTTLISNTSVDELGSAPNLVDNIGSVPTSVGLAVSGKLLLQIGGWSLAIFDFLDLLTSMWKSENKTYR